MYMYMLKLLIHVLALVVTRRVYMYSCSNNHCVYWLTYVAKLLHMMQQYKVHDCKGNQVKHNYYE